MKGNAMPEVTTLNLNEPIDRETYERAVTHLIAFLENDLRRRMDWCEERFRYFSAVIPEFNQDAPGYVDFRQVPEDADYAKLLGEMRGRLLWYTNAGTITLDTVQEIFRSCGMPEYERPADKSGTRLKVYLRPIEINVAGTEREAIEWVNKHLNDFLIRVMDGKPPQDDDLYVPGSAVADLMPQAETTRWRPPVNEADILRPANEY
jgi:hypothetical protein